MQQTLTSNILLIKRLPSQANAALLTDLFGKYGLVEKVKIIASSSGQPGSCHLAVIQLKTVDSALHALNNLNGSIVCDKQVSISYCPKPLVEKLSLQNGYKTEFHCENSSLEPSPGKHSSESSTTPLTELNKDEETKTVKESISNKIDKQDSTRLPVPPITTTTTTTSQISIKCSIKEQNKLLGTKSERKKRKLSKEGLTKEEEEMRLAKIERKERRREAKLLNKQLKQNKIITALPDNQKVEKEKKNIPPPPANVNYSINTHTHITENVPMRCANEIVNISTSEGDNNTQLDELNYTLFQLTNKPVEFLSESETQTDDKASSTLDCETQTEIIEINDKFSQTEHQEKLAILEKQLADLNNKLTTCEQTTAEIRTCVNAISNALGSF